MYSIKGGASSDANDQTLIHESLTGAFSRRALLGTGLAVASAASLASKADAASSDMHHDANVPLPLASKDTDALLFPGFRQSFIPTQGTEVEGKMASGG